MILSALRGLADVRVGGVEVLGADGRCRSRTTATTKASQPKTAVFQWFALQRPIRAAKLFECFSGDNLGLLVEVEVGGELVGPHSLPAGSPAGMWPAGVCEVRVAAPPGGTGPARSNARAMTTFRGSRTSDATSRARGCGGQARLAVTDKLPPRDRSAYPGLVARTEHVGTLDETELLERMTLVAEAFRPSAPIDRRSLFSGGPTRSRSFLRRRSSRGVERSSTAEDAASARRSLRPR